MALIEHTIRRAGPADAAAVDALTQAAYAKWVPVIGRKPRPMTADYARAVVDHQVDVIEIDGALAGLIELSHEADHLLIVNVAVAPTMQRQGIGTRLLDHAEAVAGAAGFTKLRLYTNSLMAENITRYRRLGYEIEREERTPGWAAVHMIKRLGEPGRARLAAVEPSR